MSDSVGVGGGRMPLAHAWARDPSLRPFLEAYYSNDPTPSLSVLEILAQQCNATTESVQEWFKAKRQRDQQIRQMQQRQQQQQQMAQSAHMARATPTPPLPDNVQQRNQQTPSVQMELKFAILSLQIGTWRLTSRLRGDISGEFDLRKQTFVWERLDRGVRQRMEMPFRFLAGIELSAMSQTSARISMEFAAPAQFFEESNPRPMKDVENRVWQAIADFTTDRQASSCRRHTLICSKGDVEQHLRRLIAFAPSIKQLISRGLPKRGEAQS